MKPNNKQQRLNDFLAGVATPQTEPEREQTNGKNYVVVSYSLHPDLVDNVKTVAVYEGKHANAVVADALRDYFAKWKPEPKKIPVLK